MIACKYNLMCNLKDCLPNEMTPIAWKMPSFIVKSLQPKFPLESAGTVNPCVKTAIKMIIMLIKASVLAFASYIKTVSTS
jgi:hypothetical protein